MKEYYEYLDGLKEIGLVLKLSLFPDYLMRQFSLPSSQAHEIVDSWKRSRKFSLSSKERQASELDKNKTQEKTSRIT